MELKACEYCKKEFKNLGVHQITCKGVSSEIKNDLVKEQTDLSTPVTKITTREELRIEELESTVVRLSETLARVIDRLDAISEKSKVVEYNTDTTKFSDYKPSGYVPPKYRQICDDVLSPEFGFDCIENKDNMDFEIKIVVPSSYSTLTEVEKQSGVLDIRSKVISRALGENGVREHCMKVRDNLNKFFTRSGIKSPFISQVAI